MSVQLTAEQKNILNLLIAKSVYTIPPYQRPYSWGEDECEALFVDLENAYTHYKHLESNDKKDYCYFLGNIILSTSNRDEYEVIDGQQRLTTLTILLKILLGYDKENDDLKTTIWLVDPRTKEQLKQRLLLKTLMSTAKEDLEKILKPDYNEDEKQKSDNQFYKNIYLLKQKVKEFSKHYIVADFIDFLLEYVVFLPIYVQGHTSAQAREQALKIFETVNNRGKPLDDSDIFKSTLYYKANRNKKEDEFINDWNDFEEKCINMGESNDSKLKLRVFRIYSYICRGENGIKSAEKGLREFYEKDDISPFKTKKDYKENLDDLNKILESIEIFENICEQDGSELAKWFQLIDLYSNMYPKDTTIIYLYKNYKLINKNSEDPMLINFAKNLVKSIYSKGATATIKFDMYALMVDIMYNKDITPKIYRENLSFDRNSNFGAIYKGFSLLGSYLNKEQKSVFPYQFIKAKDLMKIADSQHNYIGNTIPSNLTFRKISLNKEDIKFLDLKDMLKENKNKLKIDDWINTLKTRYEEFFEVNE